MQWSGLGVGGGGGWGGVWTPPHLPEWDGDFLLVWAKLLGRPSRGGWV